METREKKYYKISEVAEILGINASTLRFWETEFTIIKPKRNANNTRFYTADDIETIKMVYYLVKEKGLKLEAAQQQIKVNRQNVSQKTQIIDRLKDMKQELNNLLNALNKIH